MNRWQALAILIGLLVVLPVGMLLLVDWLAGVSARIAMRDYERKTGEKWPFPFDGR